MEYAGSFCTFDNIFEEIENLIIAQAILYRFSNSSSKIDSRFGNACDFRNKITELTNKEPITTIENAEPVGPKGYLICNSSLLAIL